MAERNDIRNDVPMPEGLNDVFRSARGLSMVAPEYMETRILAELRERRHGEALKWTRMWKRLAIGSSFLSVAAVSVVVWFLAVGSHFSAVVNEPFAVHIELNRLETENIARAEIELPDGVQFYIEQFPELMQQRKLSLAFRKNPGKDYFSFVVRATEGGTKTVKVRFLDASGGVVAERNLDIRMMPAQRKG